MLVKVELLHLREQINEVSVDLDGTPGDEIRSDLVDFLEEVYQELSQSGAVVLEIDDA
jgi:hypothetical protein